MKAVILAGGKGTRLAPYTKILPKPLLPIGEMPILEILLRQMKPAGDRRSHPDRRAPGPTLAAFLPGWPKPGHAHPLQL